MKTMSVFEARNNFSRTLEAAKDDVVVVTRNGRPVAAIHAIGDDDLEDLLLERSDRFWEMIARARRGKAVSLESVSAELGGRRGSRGRKPSPRRVGRPLASSGGRAAV